MPSFRILLALAPLVLCACTSTPDDYDDRLDAWDREREARPRPATSDAPDPERTPEPPALPGDAGLDEVLAYARANNSALEAAFQRWREALEQVESATSLPEPRLTFAAYLAEVETRVGPMQGRVGISQRFPWFGSLDLAGEIALREADAARARLESVRLDIEQRVRTAWLELAWLERSITITRGNLELVALWEGAAQGRFAAGLGRNSDLIRTQIELGRLEDRIRSLEDMRRPMSSELNALLGRPPAAPLPAPSLDAEFAAPPPDEQLAARLAAHPDLQSIDRRIEAAELAVELGDDAYYPSLVLGVDYTFIGSASTNVAGSGDDAIAVSLGFDLPVRRTAYAARIRAARARAMALRSEREDTIRRLGAELDRALYDYRDSQRRIALYTDSLIPKGEQALDALDVAYRAGEQSFLEVVDAQRTLLEFQLQVARATADREKARARILRLVGDGTERDG